MQTPLSLPLRRRPMLSLGLPSLRRSAAPPRPLDVAEAYGATDAELTRQTRAAELERVRQETRLVTHGLPR